MSKELEVIKHTIELVPAQKKDFVELVGIKPDGSKIFKLRYGVPFWLRSIDGHIENNNYLTGENTSFKELKGWFHHKTIYTLKSRWL